jgi:hypothetical protein
MGLFDSSNMVFVGNAFFPKMSIDLKAAGSSNQAAGNLPLNS